MSEAEIKPAFTGQQSRKRVFYPAKELSEKAYIKSLDEYRELYQRSIEDPEGFWGELAEQLGWYHKWDKVLVEDFKDGKHQWFVGGKLNVCYNCLDRHLKTGRKNKAALIWEGEPLGESRTFTYQQLHYEVCKFANVLKKLGVKKGDRVFIYLPKLPELAVAMLACARIGAVHHITFAGFSAQTIRDRIQNCAATLIICCDGYYHDGKVINSKANVDEARADCPSVKNAIVIKRASSDIRFQAGRDLWWDELMKADDITPICEPEVMDSEDPLFLLYTSGTTGKPKGMVHVQGSYLVYGVQNLKWMLDVKEEDTFWCTAYIAIYMVYAPLAMGSTTIMYEGSSDYPYPDRFWEIIEKYRVDVFYTAPSDLRALMREGDGWPGKHDLSSLRVLGLVGELIGAKAWMWYYKVIGGGRCPISDTWGQNEGGGIMISPMPGATPLKIGSATLPLPGIEAAVVREDGSPAGVNEDGYLVIKRPWPGLMRGVYGDPEQFKDSYFTRFPGWYNTGDGARIDEDGYFWITGRVDDNINVYGYRVAAVQVENALMSHQAVAEAAVVGIPHEIKGQGICAYAVLKPGEKRSEELKKVLTDYVTRMVDCLATPDRIQFVDALPKTMNGKIMRRILARIATGDIDNLGDTSALANPSVVGELIKRTKSDGTGGCGKRASNG